MVADASDIERAGQVLFDRLWLAGHGYFKVSSAGTLLSRTLVDGSVYQPSRLDFVAGAVCKPPLVQERATLLSEVPDWVDFVFLAEPEVDEASWAKVMDKGRDVAVTMLDGMIVAWADCDWEAGKISDTVFSFAEANGITSKKKAQAPLRVAVTGRAVGPPLWESVEVMGRDETLRRLRAARARL